MKKYFSEKTEKGNVGVSCNSQEEANAQAKQMDNQGCTNCNDCINCINCTNCTNCIDCINCTNCTNCNDCTNCYNCNDCDKCDKCNDCDDCDKCYNCNKCNDCNKCVGVLIWRRHSAEKLLALNGLRWPIATDGEYLQIGCQNHKVTDWKDFDDTEIDIMARGALDFWKNYKQIILSFAEASKHL